VALLTQYFVNLGADVPGLCTTAGRGGV